MNDPLTTDPKKNLLKLAEANAEIGQELVDAKLQIKLLKSHCDELEEHFADVKRKILERQARFKGHPHSWINKAAGELGWVLEVLKR